MCPSMHPREVCNNEKEESKQTTRRHGEWREEDKCRDIAGGREGETEKETETE
jgi:hypothetical protein